MMLSSKPLVEEAKRTKMLHMSDSQLIHIPRVIFTQLTGLVRLDLGYNLIADIPSDIGLLTSLEQLWLNHNPLATLPPEIHLCKKLREMDISHTQVENIPKEIGRLKYLMHVDLRGTPLKNKLVGFKEDTDGLMAYLDYRDARRGLKAQLEEGLLAGLYLEVATDPAGPPRVAELVKACGKEFPDLEELRAVVRHRDRLFPPEGPLRPPANRKAPARIAKEIRERFLVLRKKNEMKKLSADLELKMRAIYYDAIDISEVEGYIRSIYEHMDTVENVKFIIQYAKKIMPEKPEDITGELVYSSMLRHQEVLTQNRQIVVDGLFQALTGIYADKEPPLVRELTEEVSKLFQRERFATSKEIEEMKKLAADAAEIFPSEFESAKPSLIKRVFKQREAMQKATMNML